MQNKFKRWFLKEMGFLQTIFGSYSKKELARIEPIKIEEREKLLDALTEIADTDPLLRYYVDTIKNQNIISFLATVQ